MHYRARFASSLPFSKSFSKTFSTPLFIAFVMGLAPACTEDGSGATAEAGADASAAADAASTGEPSQEDSADEGSGTIDPGGEPAEDDDGSTGSADDASEGTECAVEPLTLCDDGDVVEVDQCDDTRVVLESCERECYQGRCEDCLPTSGVICDDGNVHQLDSCGLVGAELDACENGCNDGACIAADCTPRESLECEGRLLWEVDSCGNRTNVADLCVDGCDEDACAGCEDEGETLCYEGNVHAIDSCGTLGELLSDCAGTCSSVRDGQSAEARCVDDGGECMESGGIACLGDLRAVDSCGNVLAEVIEDCPNGCDEEGCLPCEPRPVGLQCVGDSVYRTIGGCGEPAVPEAEPLELCEFGCDSGECNADECAPNAGSTCNDGDVHSVDSCGALGPRLEECAGGCALGECVVSTGADAGPGLDSGAPTAEAGVDAATSEGDAAAPAPEAAAPVPDAGGSDASAPDAG